MRRLAIILMLAAVAAAAGCGGTGGEASDDAGPAPDLAGRSFVSTEVTGRDLVHGSTIAIAFEQGSLSASAGCNTVSGAYVLDGAVLRLDGEAATTMIGCDPDHAAQDEWLTAFLTDGATATEEGGRLTLAGGDVTVVLKEGRPGGEPPPLLGTTWTLETLIEGDVAASVPAGVEPPTLRISKNGTAAVFTGCNRGRAPVEVRDDGFLVFGPLALTRMACEPDARQVEDAVTAILDGRVAIAFDGPQLAVAKSGHHLLYRGG